MDSLKLLNAAFEELSHRVCVCVPRVPEDRPSRMNRLRAASFLWDGVDFDACRLMAVEAAKNMANGLIESTAVKPLVGRTNANAIFVHPQDSPLWTFEMSSSCGELKTQTRDGIVLAISSDMNPKAGPLVFKLVIAYSFYAVGSDETPAPRMTLDLSGDESCVVRESLRFSSDKILTRIGSLLDRGQLRTVEEDAVLGEDRSFLGTVNRLIGRVDMGGDRV